MHITKASTSEIEVKFPLVLIFSLDLITYFLVNLNLRLLELTLATFRRAFSSKMGFELLSFLKL